MGKSAGSRSRAVSASALTSTRSGSSRPASDVSRPSSGDSAKKSPTAAVKKRYTSVPAASGARQGAKGEAPSKSKTIAASLEKGAAARQTEPEQETKKLVVDRALWDVE